MFVLWAVVLTDLSKPGCQVGNLSKAMITVHMSNSFLVVTESDSEMVRHTVRVIACSSGSVDCYHNL